MRARKARRGAALLEAMTALAILSVAGIAALQMVRASSNAVAAVQATDAAVARANAHFDAMALWPNEDLDRNLGERVTDDLRVTLAKSGTIYRATLADTLTNRVLLETALFRRDASSGAER